MTFRLLAASAAALTLAACSAPAPKAGVDNPEFDSAAYMAQNAKADGVIVNESGLQYTLAQAGLENGASPEPGQQIAAHYHGTFRNGEVFDSSYERGQPLIGPSNGFIKAWNEALGDMKVCEARTLYVSPELGYGNADRGPIPGGSVLIFNMQLLAVNTTDAAAGTNDCPEDKILAGPESY
jgi:FKBP-type peptidyl-prolyl cis-trans isomerase